MKIVISGGGTGGHIYPAIAIADAIKRREPNADILFIGAKGRMEMEKVPKAGYKIEGLWISGFQRKLTLANLTFPFKLLSSLWKARQILKRFRPDVVIGVGGYASGPCLQMATSLGIQSLVHEQNSHAGATNRILSKKVQKVCVAYDNMERFFPKEKIVFVGNPIRQDILSIEGKRKAAFLHYGLDEKKKTVLVLGGSLGAKTLNESISSGLDALANAGIQVFWQCGKLYETRFRPIAENYENVKIEAFIDRMDYAYAVADLVISRAGALAVSEIAVCQKAVILVPSPNVAADHQTANAMALVGKDAAVLVKDKDARSELVSKAIECIQNEKALLGLQKRIESLGIKDADERLADEVFGLLP